MKTGKLYRHIYCLDMHIYVLATDKHADYGLYTVYYCDSRKILYHPDHETVRINDRDLPKWKLVD